MRAIKDLSAKNKIFSLLGGAAVITIILMSILLVLHKNDKASGDSTTRVSTTEKIYTDSSGLKITPPAGWNQVKPTPSGDIVDFQESQQDSDSAGKGQSTLSVITSQAQGSLDQYAEAISSVNTKNLKNYHEIAPHDLTIDGQPAKILNYTASVNGHELRTAQLLVVKNDVLYGFNGIGLVSSWSQHEAELSKSFASIKLPQ